MASFSSFKINILQFHAEMPSVLGPFSRILSIIADTFSFVSFLIGIRLEWQVSVSGSFTLILEPFKIDILQFYTGMPSVLVSFSRVLSVVADKISSKVKFLVRYPSLFAQNFVSSGKSRFLQASRITDARQ